MAKPLDVFILLIFVAFIIGAILLLRSQRGERSYLIISSSEGEYMYPLDADAEYSVAGTIGVSVIKVLGGTAAFADSPCPNKTCVQQGAICNSGEWAACLPNGVFIRIEGKGGTDSLSF